MPLYDAFALVKMTPTKAADTRTILLRSTDVIMIITAARKKPKGVQEDLSLKWATTCKELHKKFVISARDQLVAANVKVKWQQDKLTINNIKVNP